jgi:hypothetical protein
MLCPSCGNKDDSVIDSRPHKDAIRRRRVCANCGFRFTTLEVVLCPVHKVPKKGRGGKGGARCRLCESDKWRASRRTNEHSTERLCECGQHAVTGNWRRCAVCRGRLSQNPDKLSLQRIEEYWAKVVDPYYYGVRVNGLQSTMRDL